MEKISHYDMKNGFQIDDVVMKACREHMRSVCGDCMDQLAGPNYETIVGCAIQYMENCIKQVGH